MRRLSENAIEALAAEYVLGTLRGRARARLDALRSDPAIGDAVRRWESYLSPLASGVAAVEPPARVWKAIAERIGGSEAPARLDPWKALAALAGGFATVLLAAFLWLAPGKAPDPVFVAVLLAPDSAPRMVVSMHAPDTMRVRMVKPWSGTEGKSLELWVLPRQGLPQSLGVVANAEGEATIRIAPDDSRVSGAKAFAVSLEPPGGSPTKQPTGPILCSGPVASVRKT